MALTHERTDSPGSEPHGDPPSNESASTTDCLELYRRELWTHRAAVVAGLVATVLQSIAVLPIPLLVRYGVDRAIPNRDRRALVLVAIGIVILTAANGILAVLAQHWVQRAIKEATAAVRRRVADHVFRSEYATLSQIDGAATHERLIADPLCIETLAMTIVRQTLPSALTIVGFIVVLIRIDPALTLVTASIAPLLVLTTRGFRSMLEHSSIENQSAFEGLARNALVVIRAQPLIRSRGASWSERGRLHQRIDQLKATSARRINVITIMSATQTTVVSLATAATLAVGGIAVMGRRLTIGDLLSFFASVALVRSPIVLLATSSSAYIEGRQAARRIDHFLRSFQLGPQIVHHEERGVQPGELTLHCVTFAYPGSHPVIQDFSLSIAPGSILALAGPNGVGKSTVMAILLGLLQPQSGVVLVDGLTTNDESFEHLRQHLGVCFQHTEFFPGTVRENLLFGRPWATESDVKTTIQDAEAEAVVSRLDRGLDTVIGSNGDTLSGGERQRLAIARALLGRPSLVVLDEPSNHLPASVIQKILTRTQSWPHPPGVLLITHDVSVLAVAHCVVRISPPATPQSPATQVLARS